MKVICINGVKIGQPNITASYIAKEGDEVIEGEVYTVKKELFIIKPCYTLFEKSPRLTYSKDRFLPLSNICELEMVNELQILIL